MAEEAALRVIKVLRGKGVKFAVEERSAWGKLGGLLKFSLDAELPEKLVVVGGDGTLLNTLIRLKSSSPLIMTVRAGKRGFLLDVERYEVEERAEDFLEGRYSVVEYPRLRVYADGEEKGCIFNDLVVAAKMLKMARLHVDVDGQSAMTLDGDGVIVSTTVGSTAYSLSAGGPIVDPRIDVTVITPLNPVQLHLRPLVVPSGSQVKIEARHGSSDLVISLDGQLLHEIPREGIIHVERCPRGVRIARFREWEGFYERLYTRLLAYW